MVTRTLRGWPCVHRADANGGAYAQNRHLPAPVETQAAQRQLDALERERRCRGPMARWRRICGARSDPDVLGGGV